MKAYGMVIGARDTKEGRPRSGLRGRIKRRLKKHERREGQRIIDEALS